MTKLISILLIIAALVSLASCGSGNKAENNYSDVSASTDTSLDDDQYYLGSSVNCRMAEGPDAFYFFSGSHLYYMDKKTMKAYPLCTKPDCLHTQETDWKKGEACNSYHINQTALIYYNEGLYISEWLMKDGALSPVQAINRYNLQGELEKTVFEIPQSAGSVMQHRGIMYYVYYDIDETAEENNWGDVYFMSYDLNTGEEKTVISWPGTEVYAAGDTFAYGDNIYVQVSYLVNSEKIVYRSMYLIYNTATGEISYIKPSSEDNGVATAYIYKDKVLYTEIKYEPELMIPIEQDKDLFTADLDGSNIRKIGTMPFASSPYLIIDDYILTTNSYMEIINKDNPEVLSVYKDAKLVGTFDLSSIKWNEEDNASYHFTQITSNAGDYVIFTVPCESHSHGWQALIAVKKSDLIKGKAEPLLLFEPLECPC